MANIILKIRNNESFILEVKKDKLSREDKINLESVASAAFDDNENLNEMSNMDIALWLKEKAQEILNCNVNFLSIDLELSIN
jgi:hypothetical protein